MHGVVQLLLLECSIAAMASDVFCSAGCCSLKHSSSEVEGAMSEFQLVAVLVGVKQPPNLPATESILQWLVRVPRNIVISLRPQFCV